MATAKDFYASFPVNKISVPDWTHLGVTSPSSPTIKLSWDQIHIDDETGNNTKVETHLSLIHI